MNILVIGQPVLDEIHQSGKSYLRPGGVFFTATTLTSLRREDDELSILTSFEEGISGIFENAFSGFSDKLYQKVDKLPRVKLFLDERGDSDRTEMVEVLSGKLDISRIPDLKKFDGILINMFTNTQIDEKDIANLRKNFDKSIYIDIHTLSRGLDKKSHHFYRSIPNSQQWLKNVDIVQVNEFEFNTLSNKDSREDKLDEIFSAGIKILLITLSSSGAIAYYRSHEEILSYFVPATKNNAANSVGCGDVFGAAFFYSYLQKSDLFHSLRFANRAAGIWTSYSSESEFDNFKKDIADND